MNPYGAHMGPYGSSPHDRTHANNKIAVQTAVACILQDQTHASKNIL